MSEEQKPVVEFTSSSEENKPITPADLMKIKHGATRTQTQTESSTQTFKIPTDRVGIPSLGKVYSKNSPLHRAESIEYRHMIASDEDVLTSKALLRSGKAIDMLLKNCIVDKSINPEDLLSGDKNALMIALRVGAYGEKYLVDLECPDCDFKAKDFEVDLTTLDVKTLEVDPNNIGENCFTFTLPTGIVIEFKLLTSAEERMLAQSLENQKAAVKTQVDSLITTKHKLQIISVNGDKNKVSINRFVDMMSAGDSRALNNYITKISPDVIMEINFDCPSCGYSGKENLPITAAFFWPDK